MVGDSPDIVGEGPISDLGDLEGWWDNHSIVAWSISLFGCFLLNGTLLLAFLIRPSLRTISNRFVMNLTVSNLLVCATMNPLFIVNAASTLSDATLVESRSARSACAISEGAVAIVTTSSVLSVLLIAVDQYFAVVDPLRYRARVDKLKCGILIMSIWLVSITFGFLAFFNPNPRSFWLSCAATISKTGWSSGIATVDTLTESTVGVIEQGTDHDELNITWIPETVRTIETITLDGDIDLVENTTVIFDTFIDGRVTYGFVYAILYSIFVYFIPFVAVCWIYVSIYVAAHRNSERARRSGSRPILSSGSFTEEQTTGLNALSRLQRLQADTVEDFRKLPKISSLSSIDETSETMQQSDQVSRRRSISSSMEIEVPATIVDNQASSGIVFTVGLQRLQVSAQSTNENRGEPDLDASEMNEDGVEVESRDDDPSVTEIVYKDLEAQKDVTGGWTPRTLADDVDRYNKDNVGFECYSSLLCDHSPNFSRDQAHDAVENSAQDGGSRETVGQIDRNESVGRSDSSRTCNDDQSEGHPSRANVAVSKSGHQTCPDDFDVSGNSTAAKSNRGLSMMFTDRDVAVSDTSENARLSKSSGCDKTEKDGSCATTEPSACLLTPIVTITPAPSKNESLHRVASVRSTSSYINSLKDRISNGSIFRHREEARAARISALVIVMGLICWSPYVILLVMKNLPRSADQQYRLPHKYDILASSLLILAAYISPLLFGYRSKRVKRELRRFFCFRRELSYKNNRSLMAKKVLKRRHSSTPSHSETDQKYNIFNCVYGRNRWPKEKVQFVQVPDTALAVETCRSSFSSGASTQISSTSTEEC